MPRAILRNVFSSFLGKYSPYCTGHRGITTTHNTSSTAIFDNPTSVTDVNIQGKEDIKSKQNSSSAVGSIPSGFILSACKTFDLFIFMLTPPRKGAMQKASGTRILIMILKLK